MILFDKRFENRHSFFKRNMIFDLFINSLTNIPPKPSVAKAPKRLTYEVA